MTPGATPSTTGRRRRRPAALGRQWTGVAAALALALAPAPAAGAGVPTDTLRGFFAAGARILEDPATADRPAERLRAVRRLVGDVFDFREAARRSLGRLWPERTMAEREEFVRLFTDLVERSYVWQVATRARLEGGLLVRYLAESVTGDEATVATSVAGRDGDEIPFEYRMIRRGERWAVRDVVIDGVSVVGNYRAQFIRVVADRSYPELVRRMRALVSDVPGVWAAAADPGAGAKPDPARAAPLTLAAVGADLSAPPVGDGAGPVTAVSRGAPGAVVDAPRGVRPEPPPPIEAGLARREPVVPAADTRPRSVSYWVQVGAFRDIEGAGRLLERLRGQDRLVLNASGFGDLLSRVRIGPFADRPAAVAKLHELETLGYEPFIVTTGLVRR